jgi:hypothetical protein
VSIGDVSSDLRCLPAPGIAQRQQKTSVDLPAGGAKFDQRHTVKAKAIFAINLKTIGDPHSASKAPFCRLLTGYQQETV